MLSHFFGTFWVLKIRPRFDEQPTAFTGKPMMKHCPFRGRFLARKSGDFEALELGPKCGPWFGAPKEESLQGSHFQDQFLDPELGPKSCQVSLLFAGPQVGQDSLHTVGLLRLAGH